MKSTEFLYELDMDVLAKMIYFDALQYKLNCAKRLYRRLHYEVEGKSRAQVEKEYGSVSIINRMFFVEKAIEHTKRLIKEKEEME